MPLSFKLCLNDAACSPSRAFVRTPHSPSQRGGGGARPGLDHTADPLLGANMSHTVSCRRRETSDGPAWGGATHFLPSVTVHALRCQESGKAAPLQPRNALTLRPPHLNARGEQQSLVCLTVRGFVEPRMRDVGRLAIVRSGRNVQELPPSEAESTFGELTDGRGRGTELERIMSEDANSGAEISRLRRTSCSTDQRAANHCGQMLSLRAHRAGSRRTDHGSTAQKKCCGHTWISMCQLFVTNTYRAWRGAKVLRRVVRALLALGVYMSVGVAYYSSTQERPCNYWPDRPPATLDDPPGDAANVRASPPQTPRGRPFSIAARGGEKVG